MFDELLNVKLTGKFRESFVELFKQHIESGLSLEQLTQYMNSGEFKLLNEKSKGFGPVYLGLVIHKLLSASKIDFRDGKYVNGSGGINSSLCEEITPSQRRDLARILSRGLVIGSPNYES